MLTDWTRAIGDITDSIQASIDGRFMPATNAEQYYSATDREDVGCERHMDSADSALKALDSRLDGELGAARQSISQF